MRNGNQNLEHEQKKQSSGEKYRIDYKGNEESDLRTFLVGEEAIVAETEKDRRFTRREVRLGDEKWSDTKVAVTPRRRRH